MKAWLLLSLLLSPYAQAFHKDFALVNDRAPLEFRLLFDSLRYTLKEREDQLYLIVLAQHINKGLGPLQKDQSMFLMKSEIYKTLLEWPHNPTHFQVGSHTLDRLKSNLELNKPIYTPFSTWVIEALIADLENFQKDGLLSMSLSERASLTGEKAKQNLKFQRVMKFSRGWLEQADTLSARDFNTLTRQLSWRVMERIKIESMLLQRFSSTALSQTMTNTFNIPENAMPQSETPAPGQSGAAQPPAGDEKGLAEKAADSKAAAQGSMDKLNVKPGTLPAEELSGAIDQLDEPAATGGAASSTTPPPATGQGSDSSTEGTPESGDPAPREPAPNPAPLE